MEMEQELSKQRDKLLKAIEQGRKIESVMESPEWEFFFEWLTAVQTNLVNRLKGDGFINDHNGYLFTNGNIRAIETILKGVEQFKKAKDVANKRLDELNEIDK